MSRLFRNILFVSMCMLLTVCEESRQETNGLIDLQESRPVLKRKNIDYLTPRELATYEHAVKMMKEKSVQPIALALRSSHR